MKPLQLIAAAALVALASGCTPSADAQRSLASEASAGLQLLRAAHVERRAAIDEAQQFQRRALDSAFDQDVLARADRAGSTTQPAFDAQWIVTARKAYAAGLDALAARKAAADQADSAALANYAAVEQALAEIRLLAELQRRWSQRATEAVARRP